MTDCITLQFLVRICIIKRSMEEDFRRHTSGLDARIPIMIHVTSSPQRLMHHCRHTTNSTVPFQWDFSRIKLRSHTRRNRSALWNAFHNMLRNRVMLGSKCRPRTIDVCQ